MTEQKSSMSTSDHTIKIIVVGPSSTGKTCFVNRFVEGGFPAKSEATIAVDLKSKFIQVGALNIRLNIWDTAGQERYRSVVDLHCRGMHGCLGLFDVNNHASFDDLKQEIENIRELNDICGERIVIVGNKSDLEAEQRVSIKEIADFTSQIKSSYIEASAKTDHNVVAAFMRLVENIIDICEATRTQERQIKKRGSFASFEIQRKRPYLETNPKNLKKKEEADDSSRCC